jgi:fumarylpyruvate hydrolase
MSFVVAAPAHPSIPVKDTHLRFPVRRIYCVGRNYNDHVAEMGGTPGREPPFFFQKPADAVVTEASFPYPPMTADLQHEVEMVVALQAGGRDIARQAAESLIYGYAVGVDLTRRDLQAAMKKAAKPWEIGKAFDHSAPVGQILPRTEGRPSGASRLSLSVNGALRQSAPISDMIWDVSEIIAELSRYFELHTGDIIFTGTPKGVGPIAKGDVIDAALEGVSELSVRVA